MVTVDPELRLMRSKNELDFTIDYVIPLFKELGFRGVEYTGGNREFGRDVTCYREDSFGYKEFIAIQVKNEDIRGSTQVQELIAEAKAAFDNPYIDPYTHNEVKFSVLYIITSGIIPEYSITQIKNAMTSYPTIHFIDGNKVLSTKNYLISNFLRYSLIEGRMNEISVTALCSDSRFLIRVEALMKILINEIGASPLNCIDLLPNALSVDSDISSKIISLGESDKKCVLHWLSIYFTIKAWYNYGKNKKFGLLED